MTDTVPPPTAAEPLQVTKVFLPPFEEYCELLRQIWATHIVTNDGPLYQRFEDDLRRYTELANLVCLANGTLALQMALHVLELAGSDVITTPFTHVATSDALIWERCRPVYIDVDPETLNIDPNLIEAALTDRTSSVFGVHVYGNPCDVTEIERIAGANDLKVIYDAAHAFGTRVHDRSVLSFGDISAVSFHGTKGMHTFEGGGLFAGDPELIKRARRLAYHGMDEQKRIVQQWGTNGKMCELHAAMGILSLKYFAAHLEEKKRCYELYVSLLEGLDQIRFQKLTGEINYSYMPVVFRSEDCKQAVMKELRQHGIYPREYFHPSLETVFSDRIACPIAYDLSHRVLCLPMSDYLQQEQVRRICEIVVRTCETQRGG